MKILKMRITRNKEVERQERFRDALTTAFLAGIIAVASLGIKNKSKTEIKEKTVDEKIDDLTILEQLITLNEQTNKQLEDMARNDKKIIELLTLMTKELKKSEEIKAEALTKKKRNIKDDGEGKVINIDEQK